MPRKAISTTKNGNGPNPMEQILKGVSSILTRQHSNLVFTDLYSAVDNVVSSGKQADLARNLSNLTEERFKEWNSSLRKQVGNPLISLFSSQYDDFKIYINIIPKMFGHYDSKEPNRKSISIIEDNFFKIILKDNATIESIISQMLANIQAFRMGTDNDYSIVQNIIGLFYHFNKFTERSIFEDFKKQLEEKTQDYYTEIFQTKYAEKMNNYLKICIEKINHEKTILDVILKKDEANGLLKVAFTSLISNNESVFFAGQPPPISQSLDSDDLEPLKWLVSYYTYFEIQVDDLIKTCALYTKNKMLEFTPLFAPPEAAKSKAAKKATDGKKAPAKKAVAKKAVAKSEEAKDAPESNEDAEKKAKEDAEKKKAITTPDTVKHVEDLIHVVIKLSNAFKYAFPNCNDAIKTLEANIKKAWNTPEFNIAENFVLFCDYHLRNQMKFLSPKDLEDFPSICKDFVKRTEDKEVFKTAYLSYLLRRIIKQGDKNKKNEEDIIKEIRKVIPEFIKTLDKFYTYVKESKELLESFVQDGGLNGLDIQFNPIMFNQSDFTLEKDEVKQIPPFLAEIHDRFNKYYSQKHENEYLSLLSDLSVLEFKFSVPPNKTSPSIRNYTLYCDVLCGSILQTIASLKSPTLINIYQNVQRKQQDIKMYIKRLCSKERQILLRIKDDDAKSDSLNDTDRFTLNPKFFYKTLHVQIPPPDHNKNKIVEDITRNKSEIMRAACVQILKQRNIVTRNELETEIITRASQFFKPTLESVKIVINKLLEDDSDEKYIEELEDGRFKYIR